MDKNKANVTSTTMSQPTGRQLKVALVLVPQTAPAVLYSLLEVFNAAGTLWQKMTGQPGGQVTFETSAVCQSQKPFTGAFGVTLVPDCSLDDDSHYDIVIAPDMLLPEDFDPRGQWQATCHWLQQVYNRGAVIASVCTGSLLLAEAGLLKGQQASSHWAVAGFFDTFYPEVAFCGDRILVVSGHEQRLITTGGAGSWSELALYLIARFCSLEEARRIARIFLLGDLSHGQTPFAVITRTRQHTDQVIAACQQWLAENYDLDNPISRVTLQSGLSPRTFKRRFLAATGYQPLHYVQTLRIEEAKQMLEATHESTDDVALAVGYNDSASFRRLFKKLVGVTPAQYRRRFQKIGCQNISTPIRHRDP